MEQAARQDCPAVSNSAWSVSTRPGAKPDFILADELTTNLADSPIDG